MIIRKIEAKDYNQLAMLLSLSRQRPFSVEQLQKAGCGLKLWQIRVAVQGGDNIVGTYALSQSESDGNGRYQLNIDVHPQYQRQGIGSTLYQDALQIAQAHGLSVLYAYIKENALEFSCKQGFAPVRQGILSALDVTNFDERPFTHYLTKNKADGYHFSTFAKLGDSLENRRKLYELNKTCSADIPGRGRFHTFEEYCQQRLENPAFRPNGVMLALKDGQWVGMASVSHRQNSDFAFSEMTGVLAAHRRHGLATALKLLVIRFVRDDIGVTAVRTVTDSENIGILKLNQLFGNQTLFHTYKVEAIFNNVN